MIARFAAWRQVEARVGRHEDYGAGHRWLDLMLPGDFPEPRAGQFVQLLLRDPSSVFLPRPMSIAASRRVRGQRVLGFLYAPVGAGTRALAELPAGARIEVLGPLGRGYPIDAPGIPVLLAGGRGVAPLLFAAQALADAGRRCHFIFGARAARALVGLAEARTRLATMRGTLHLCTDDGSRGFHGNVVAKLGALAPTVDGPLVLYACGPHGMLKAVAQWGLAHRAPAHLAMESVMACGTGVCRGCPLPRSAGGRAAFDPTCTPSLFGNHEFAMCCTEGPVFEAHDLDWSRIE